MLCGFVSAVLVVLAFPPLSLWFIAPLIPVPLMMLASRGRATIGVATCAAIGTTPAWFFLHNWVFVVSTFGAPILVLYISLYAGLFVYVCSRIESCRIPRWMLLAIVWSACEFARANVLGGYAWYLTAHPLIDAPGRVLQAPARLGGATLVGLFVACVAALIAQSIRTRRPKRHLGGLVVVVGIWGVTSTAAIVGDPELGESVVVGVLQPDVPQDNRIEWTERQRLSDWKDLARLTYASARDETHTPDVIVWPEGLTPGWTFDPVSLETERVSGYGWKVTKRFDDDAPDLEEFWGDARSVPSTFAVDEMLAFQSELIGIPLIVGGPAFENLRIVETGEGFIEYQNDAQYNSVFVVVDGRVVPNWYNKNHLTPFGETMPLISRSEWLEQNLLGIAAGGMSFVLSAGTDLTVLEVPVESKQSETIRVAPPVCFEATVPSVCRNLVFRDGERRADLLVNISNDGWFVHWDPGRRSHMQNARWRALELATPMVRSANTGVSCVVDTWGRVVSDSIVHVDGDRAGYINSPIRLGAGISLYSVIGELLGYLVSGCVVLMLIWSIRTRKNQGHNRSVPDAAETA